MLSKQLGILAELTFARGTFSEAEEKRTDIKLGNIFLVFLPFLFIYMFVYL